MMAYEKPGIDKMLDCDEPGDAHYFHIIAQHRQCRLLAG